MRCESSRLALSSSRRRVGERLRPARLIKNVSMRIPELGPFGETFFDAKRRAIVAASLLNKSTGGWVESVLTFADQRRGFLDVLRLGMWFPTHLITWDRAYPERPRGSAGVEWVSPAEALPSVSGFARAGQA